MESGDESVDHVAATWIGLRVLLPFSYARPRGAPPDRGISPARIPEQIFDRMLALRLGDREVWRPGTPHQTYIDELIEPVQTAVFPTDDRRYWQVTAPTLDRLFQGAFVDLGERGKVPLKPYRPFGIELFLSNFGFGLLSIAIEADLTPGHAAATALELTYRLSQVLGRKLTPLRWPHPFDDPSRKQKILEQGRGDAIAAIPADDAVVTERIGAPGVAVALPELARFLLPFDMQPFQVSLRPGDRGDLPGLGSGQFNVYSVVRIANASHHTLSEHPGRAAIESFLMGLAQIQEPHHAGNQVRDSHVVTQLLNRHHWAACTSLAAAHVVLDQPRNLDWMTQAPQHYLSKYFIPTLLAHHQRRHAELVVAASRDVAQDLMSGRVGVEARVNDVTREMLQFELSTAFPTVSTRHVVNVWYEQCQTGERAATALAHARDALARLDAALSRARQEQIARATVEIGTTNARLAEQAKKNLDVVAHVQKNVEWIEIFIIGVYTLEAAHQIVAAFGFGEMVPAGHEHEWHAFEGGSLILLPIIAATIAFFVLRPDKTEEAATHGSGGKQRFWRSQPALLLTLALLIVAWTGLCRGLCWWFANH